MSLRQKITQRIPKKLAGAAEYYLRPRIRETWGEAFNNQSVRRSIFVDLVKTCGFTAIVETGTFRGTTTAYMAEVSERPVYSSELDPRFFAYAAQRLRKFSQVKLYNEDSRTFLKHLNLPTEKPIFFYLDAHWNSDLPLREESDTLFSTYKQAVIMIDDFEVPGDPGYRFDDYGPGKKLSLDDFPFQKDAHIAVYFPAKPSEAESGPRRGCVVLASAALAAQMDRSPCLRRLNGP